ncbi:MAG TPA: 3-deoxy-manno-octulosonate cytidylyltransferase [Bryobacteraceae bacterium]|nr:3-deoxy-manno-octulosonate cytidylyltransferase [Bryobacteraceae bacterium]
MKAVGVIPARYKSTRLEGKPLADIHGRPMVWHVYERAARAGSLGSVVVATDDERIRSAVIELGGRAMMTRADHFSGTDRVAEVAESVAGEIFVNIQGDEPLIDPRMIDECVEALVANPQAAMSTLMKCVPESAYGDLSVVKVVCDLKGRALYFSRSLIPFPRTRTARFRVFEHIGLYAYTRPGLATLAHLPPSPLEEIEGLEQLRALENGLAIQVAETRCDGQLVSVDTAQDLERVRQILEREVVA